MEGGDKWLMFLQKTCSVVDTSEVLYYLCREPNLSNPSIYSLLLVPLHSKENKESETWVGDESRPWSNWR